MKLLIQVSMPKPNAAPSPTCPPKVSIEEHVKDCIECIESGHNSSIEWITINKLYRDLEKRKATPRVQNLKKMIEPTLAKYGYHKKTDE